MLFLFDRFGTDFMSALHRDGDLQGLASLDARSKRSGVDEPLPGVARLPELTLVDRIVGNPPFGIVLGYAEEPGDHGEPELDGEPGQPGSPTTTRARHPTARTTCHCRRPTVSSCADAT